MPREPCLPAAEPIVIGRFLRRPSPVGAFARPLRLTFASLGATCVKFGQLVASSSGVFCDAVANDFPAFLLAKQFLYFKR